MLKPPKPAKSISRQKSPPGVTVPKSLLSQAESFLLATSETIYTGAVSSMSDDIVIGAYCVVHTLVKALSRRLSLLRPRIELILDDVGEVGNGTKAISRAYGAFRVVRRDVNADKTRSDITEVRNLLRRKNLAFSTAIDTPEPSVNESRLAALVKTGQISKEELESVQVPREVKPQLEIEVDDSAADVIEKMTLGWRVRCASST